PERRYDDFMNDARFGGLAFLTATMLMIITMAFHPTGHDLIDPERFSAAARIATLTHTLALLSLPLWTLGGIALTRELKPRALPVAALVVYGFGLIAAMIAGAASGLIGPSIAEAMHGAAENAGSWRVAFRYNGLVNRAFASIFVIASTGAIVLWSASGIRGRTLPRGMGIFGMVAGIAVIAAFVGGHVGLDVHGFGLIMLVEEIWFVGVALWMIRRYS
ncbi:MAG: hypothetical protein KY432_01720, partial [Acidobacteria bacterium]|nr:hypothetical protein [Acidobacteriota bacterium]